MLNRIDGGNNPVLLVDPEGLAWQFSVGISGTVGGMIPPFILAEKMFQIHEDGGCCLIVLFILARFSSLAD